MASRIRLLVFGLALVALAGPISESLSPALAQGYHASRSMFVLRAVPTIAGTVAGWVIGSQFGTVGKVVGAFVGFQVGKWIGKFLARQIADVVWDPYPYPVPWQPSSSTAGLGPFAPSSTPIATLRERWLAALGEYEQALKSGDGAAKASSRAAYEKAQQEYEAAKSRTR